MSRTFRFKTEVWLPRGREQVFSFFADTRNLEILTPAWLKFRIRTPGPIRVKAGTQIDYRISLHGIPMKWKTEISVWQPPEKFIDIQLHGPYRHWVHEHRFQATAGGTKVTDDIRYYPWGGRLVDRLFVHSEIERIFQFRARKLKELFAIHPEGSPPLRETKQVNPSSVGHHMD